LKPFKSLKKTQKWKTSRRVKRTVMREKCKGLSNKAKYMMIQMILKMPQIKMKKMARMNKVRKT
jgi:hypothetical protein